MPGTATAYPAQTPRERLCRAGVRRRGRDPLRRGAARLLEHPAPQEAQTRCS